MAYARNLSGANDAGLDMMQDSFAGVKRTPTVPAWAYEEMETGLSPEATRALVAFGAVAKKQSRQVVKTRDGRKVPLRAEGTQLWVPGYLDDQTQEEVDMAAMDMMQDGFGLAPLVVAAASKGISLFHSSSKDRDMAEVDRRFAAAIAGNPMLFVGQTALQSLLSGAGKDPLHPGGFATMEGRAYSYQKYQEAVARGVGAAPVGAPGTVTPGYLLPPPPQPIGILAPGGGQPPLTNPIINWLMPPQPSTGAFVPPGPGPDATADMPGAPVAPTKAGTLDLGALTQNPMVLLSIVGFSLFLMANKRR